MFNMNKNRRVIAAIIVIILVIAMVVPVLSYVVL